MIRQPARPKRLGMLVPSSNTVIESTMHRSLPADGSVTVHIARLRVVTIDVGADSYAQFDEDRVLEAAELLADAHVDRILWNGTAASWLSFHYDERLVWAIEQRTGIAASTALLAVNAALGRQGAQRIGLVTPYVAEIEAKIVANYARAGIAVVSAVRSDLSQNTAFAEIADDTIDAMVRDAGRSRPDAIVILCTNVAGGLVAQRLTGELELPVLDAATVAIAHSLALLV